MDTSKQDQKGNPTIKATKSPASAGEKGHNSPSKSASEKSENGSVPNTVPGSVPNSTPGNDPQRPSQQ